MNTPTNTIDWQQYLQPWDVAHEPLGSTANFIANARDEIQAAHLYADPTEIQKLETAGHHIEGISYFQGLFDTTPLASRTSQLRSLVIGGIAHAKPGLVSDAYRHITRIEDDIQLVNDGFTLDMNRAIWREALNRGGANREAQLVAARKVLSGFVRRQYLRLDSAAIRFQTRS